jgi:hypothetical protein
MLTDPIKLERTPVLEAPCDDRGGVSTANRLLPADSYVLMLGLEVGLLTAELDYRMPDS